MKAAASIKIGLVDDHKLFRRGLINLIEVVSKDYEVLFEADNGFDLQRKLVRHNLPDIIVMDVNMPGMDGLSSVKWLRETYPAIKVLIVSMVEKEEVILELLKLGVKGYLCKDVEPKELGEALAAVSDKGFFYTDFVTGKLVHSLQQDETSKNLMNEREKEFLRLACSEMTYHEIADKMCLSPKTIDGYRDSLFDKLKVKSRVGLVIWAVKHGHFKID